MCVCVCICVCVFFEVVIESWPEWDLNRRPLNLVRTL